jgi:hypothetical protein
MSFPGFIAADQLVELKMNEDCTPGRGLLRVPGAAEILQLPVFTGAGADSSAGTRGLDLPGKYNLVHTERAAKSNHNAGKIGVFAGRKPAHLKHHGTPAAA